MSRKRFEIFGDGVPAIPTTVPAREPATSAVSRLATAREGHAAPRSACAPSLPT